jgi:plasmid stabilization system protein ParE
VPSKLLEFSHRAVRDIERIEDYYAEVAGEATAERVSTAVIAQAVKIAELGLLFRPGIRQGTRECVMTRYPYTVVYRSTTRFVKIVRVLHQRAEYFNRR